MVNRPLRWTDFLVDAACCGFAAWTLLCHAVVASGGHLKHLALATGALALVGVLVTIRRWPSATAPAPTARHGVGPQWSKTHTVCAAAAAAAVALWVMGAQIAAWFTLVLALGTVWLRSELAAEPAPANEAPDRTPAVLRRRSALLWLAVLIGVVAALVLHRPDSDDGFYVNLALHAATEPGAPLLARDTLHGVADWPLQLPVYRLHSYELLAALGSWLSGVRPIVWLHLVFPAAAGALLVLASARLLRAWVPSRWLPATLFVLAFYLLVGGTARTWSNFGFVRLQQGKAVFASVAVPLLLAFALEYGRKPTVRRWLRLAAAQIAGVGLTASALWIGPWLCTVGLLASRPRGGNLRRWALGWATCLYPLVCAFILIGPTRSRLQGVWSSVPTPEDWFAAAKWSTGAGAFALSVAVATALAWTTLRGSGRRLAAFLPLAFLLTLFNPFTFDLVATHLVGRATSWRVFWVLPAPFLLAVVFTFPLEWKRPRPAVVRMLLAVVAATVWLMHVPKEPLVSRKNRTRVRPFELKVPGHFDLVRSLVASVPAGSTVLASQKVAPWIPTLPGHPAPLVVKPHYLDLYRDRLGDPEHARRLRLFRFVSRGGGSVEQFFEDMAHHELAAIAFEKPLPRGSKKAFYRGLSERGFVRGGAKPRHEFWLRSSEASRPSATE